MIPEEIYASSGPSSQTFKYAHPLSHEPVNDGSIRARVAYDLMTFMQRSDCPYFLDPENFSSYNPDGSEDEIDIMIVDGFYKEAAILAEQRLSVDSQNEKALFQKAFIDHLQREYENLLEREEKILYHEPRNINALINKGFALANLGREEEALALANKALEVDPKNLTVLTNKAYIAKLLGKDDIEEVALARAFDVAKERRIEELRAREAVLLEEFGSEFINDGRAPSAFDDFNQSRGTLH